MPGTHIFIKPYDRESLNSADYAFLGAWNFKREILKKEKTFLKEVVNLLLMSRDLKKKYPK